jgi:hypothetical protein
MLATDTCSQYSLCGSCCMLIRTKPWHSEISLQRQQHSYLPWAVSAASHSRSHAACGQYMPFRLSFSVVTISGSREDGGGGGMLKKVLQIDSMRFNSCHVHRRGWDTSYGSAELKLPHNRRTGIFIALTLNSKCNPQAPHPYCWHSESLYPALIFFHSIYLPSITFPTFLICLLLLGSKALSR